MDSDKIDIKGLNSLTMALNQYGENTKKTINNIKIFNRALYEFANNNYEFQIDLIKQNPNLSRTQKYYLIKKFKALRKENWR